MRRTTEQKIHEIERMDAILERGGYRSRSDELMRAVDAGTILFEEFRARMSKEMADFTLEVEKTRGDS